VINIKKLNLGFTLVELLIVIGLLGAIALIVIAAINPIEQANRARDTRFKADSGQLISAIDRYFAANSEFPWMTGTTVENDDAVTFVSAQDPSIGICLATGCADDGNLISTNELKTEFRNRDFIQDATEVSEMIWVGKDSGASSSVYACFIPLSNSERNKADNLKSLSFTNGLLDTCVAPADWSTGTPCYVCLPQ